MNQDFWTALDNLVEENGFEMERPKDSRHPRYPDYIYPLDYGFIPNTSSSDGDDIDAWQGSLKGQTVTAVVATFDPVKKDMEIKILLGCTKDDMDKIVAAHSRGDMTAQLIERVG